LDEKECLLLKELRKAKEEEKQLDEQEINALITKLTNNIKQYGDVSLSEHKWKSTDKTLF
jgi:hypothetical protein